MPAVDNGQNETPSITGPRRPPAAERPGRLLVRGLGPALPPSDGKVAAHVTAPALTFPDWGTQRSSWRDSDVTVTGDSELAARFLDTVNVI